MQRQKANIIKSYIEKQKSAYNQMYHNYQFSLSDNLTTWSVKSVKKEKGFKKVNQYEILGELGWGTFSKVYLCKDTVKDKKYAMKVLNV